MGQFLKERQEHVLDFIVRDFIRTAFPVSSKRITQKGKIMASSATIRNTMLELDHEGYLEQPHVSGGRMPSDKGYRYFVDHLVSSGIGGEHKTKHLLEGPVLCDDDIESWVENFAHELHMFATATFLGNRAAHYHAGFREVLSEPEFSERSMLRSFAEIVDDIDNVIEEYRSFLDIGNMEGYHVWIGRENHRGSARNGSAFAARICWPKDDEMVFFAFGPKRVNYEGAIRRIEEMLRTYG